MGLGFANLVMLFGLAALALPPLIHLLNRRRFDVVDWGAMQFLQVGETVRRRILIEELLLMALSSVIAVGGIGIAWYFFRAKPAAADAVAERAGGLRTLLVNKYYVDEVYDAAIVQPIGHRSCLAQHLAPALGRSG